VARSFALWPLIAAECGDKLVPVTTHPLEPWIAVESVDPNDPIAAPSDEIKMSVVVDSVGVSAFPRCLRPKGGGIAGAAGTFTRRRSGLVDGGG